MRTRARRRAIDRGLIAFTCLVVAIALTMPPAPVVVPMTPLADVTPSAEAATTAVNCNNARYDRDADADGLSDKDECDGIILNKGTAAAVTVPRCPGTSVFGCLDPNRKDLFVILAPAATSLIPSNPFELVSNPATGSPTTGAIGLGVTTHQITNDNAVNGGTDDRVIFINSRGAKTWAVRVSESADNLSSGTVLGQASNGTPSTTGKVVVWPVRILQHINEVRAAATNRLPALPATDPIVVNYIKQVIAHEIGHVTGPMANVDAATASLYGGLHNPPADVKVMSQYVTNDGTGNVLIPDDFTTGDQAALKLK